MSTSDTTREAVEKLRGELRRMHHFELERDAEKTLADAINTLTALLSDRDDLRARLEASQQEAYESDYALLAAGCPEEAISNTSERLAWAKTIAAAQAREARLREAWQRMRPSFKGFMDEVAELDGRLRCYREELPRLEKELWDMDHALADGKEQP